MEHVKKILLLSTGDVNGAYEAIYRLGTLFKSENYHVKMLVKNKTKPDDFIVIYNELSTDRNKKTIFKRLFSKFKKKLFSNSKITKSKFDLNYDFISTDEQSINTNPSRIVSLIGFVPDYIYTGMTTGFMNSTDLLNLQQLTKAKVYNITVDMNHFTGGCHFAWDCKAYINGCDTNCPAILDKNYKGLAKLNFETKFNNAKKGNFKIIAGSGWTLKQAKESMIYKNQTRFFNVNSIIDTKVFNDNNRNFAKTIFNLEENKFYILTGCQTAKAKRKGFEYLVEALKILHQNLNEAQRNKIVVLTVSRTINESFENIPFKKQHIDYINDYRLLSLLYQASDVFVNSSIEDSGPMMVSEALACGTPVVGFDMGVVTNMVINDYNGYKAKLKDCSDLANGIHAILILNKKEFSVYSKNAVMQVEEFSCLEYVKGIFKQIME